MKVIYQFLDVKIISWKGNFFYICLDLLNFPAMTKRLTLSLSLFLLLIYKTIASQLLISMDEKQKDHLKSYGVAYWILQQEVEVDWLLNYKGGSFAFRYSEKFEKELMIRGISYAVV